MELTLAVKLAPSPEQHEALVATLERFNAACNAIAEVAFREHLANKIALHLYATLRVPDVPTTDVDDFLGFDLGIVNIATDSDATVYSGASVEQQRRCFAHRRRNLQRRRTRSAKRKLQALRRKQARSNSTRTTASARRWCAPPKTPVAESLWKISRAFASASRLDGGSERATPTGHSLS